MNLHRWFSPKTKNKTVEDRNQLRGAPATPRLKTYSAETGFVYQYVYRGYRDRDDEPGLAYRFSVTRDRKTYFFVTVILSLDAKEQWQQMSGRELLDVEGYAVSKMALFAALDGHSEIRQLQAPVVLSAHDINGHLQTLDRL